MIRTLTQRSRLFNFQFISGNIRVVLCKVKIDNCITTINAANFGTSNKTLYLLVLYYCCVLIATTPAVANEQNTFVFKIDSNKILNTIQNDKRDYNFIKFNESRGIGSKDYSGVRAIYVRKRQILNAPNMPDEADEYESDEYIDDELFSSNKSVNGMHVGASCQGNCNPKLHHVSCDPITKICSCDRNYPVLLGLFKGCGKPKQLGEQCFYHQTCQYNDENSLCVQVSHNAMCQCASGYHSVVYTKPTKRVFCTEDLATITSDLPTLLGVTTGIAVLAGLICMVLHLFSKTKYPRHRNLADANLPPPIMYSSDTAQSGRPSSRSSLHSSGSIGSYGNRRPSSAPQPGSKGVLVSTSRTGSRRPSLASIHSTSSSVRSYGIMRYEKEIQQKEIRQEMKLRLARLQQQQYSSQTRPQIVIGGSTSQTVIPKMIMPTSSPLTPNSLDELLPSVDESQEIFTTRIDSGNSNNVGYQGPCTSSSEAI